MTPPAAEVVVGDAFAPVGTVRRDLSRRRGVGIFIVLVRQSALREGALCFVSRSQGEVVTHRRLLTQELLQKGAARAHCTKKISEI